MNDASVPQLVQISTEDKYIRQSIIFSYNWVSVFFSFEFDSNLNYILEMKWDLISNFV